MKKFFIISLWCIILISNSFIASKIEEIWPALMDAINTGAVEKVKTIVPKHIRANEKTRGGKTVLEHALRTKQSEVVNYLVSTIDLIEFLHSRCKGELLDIVIPAIELGRMDIVQIIIPEQIAADEQTKGGKSLITIANENQQSQVVDYLHTLSLKNNLQDKTTHIKSEIAFNYPQ